MLESPRGSFGTGSCVTCGLSLEGCWRRVVLKPSKGSSSSEQLRFTRVLHAGSGGLGSQVDSGESGWLFLLI